MKYFKLLLVVICLVAFTGCGKKNEQVKSDALKFKEEYEVLNNKKNDFGKTYKELSISKSNPIKYSSYEEILDIIENKTGIIYLGYPECPWCRTAIEVLFEAAKDYEIDTIYYLNMKNERDYYEVKDDKLVLKKDENGKEIKGTEGYFKLLKALDSELEDYVIEENDKTYEVGEKRIYVPLIIFVNDGKIVGTHTSTVATQESGYDKLTDEEYDELNGIYADYIKQLVDNYCTEAC